MGLINDLERVITPTIQISDNYNELYIKRDDLLPFSFGGNKVRIAIELIKDVKRRENDCVIGYGGSKSNLNRALSNIGNYYEIPCYIISSCNESGQWLESYNSLLSKECGSRHIICDKKM